MDRPDRHLRVSFAVAIVTCAVFLSGCKALRVAKTPMDTQLERSSCSAKSSTLLVFLPGRYADIEDFRKEGLVGAVRERRIDADVMLADAHMGYYNNRTVVDRLEADVFAPARSAGYRQIWIAGISLGGLGAVLHEQAMPGSVAGMVLIAPYLGEKPAAAEIEAPGGLRQWKAQQGPLPKDALEATVWRWLQETTGDTGMQSRPALYLGYATEDRFIYSHRLLANALPASHVFTTPGGHDWPEWNRLWRQALGVLPLPVCR